MVKKWQARKWYFCTILDAACGEDISLKPEKDCADCGVYQEWKERRKKKAKAPTTKNEKEKAQQD